MGKKENVRSYYNQYSNNYDTFYGPIQRVKFLHVKDDISPSSFLLDLGGGSGLLAEWMSIDLINLDISFDMIRFGLQDRRFQGIAGDLENLPFRTGCCNNIISFTAIQNTTDINQTFSEIRRIISSNYHGLLTFLKKTSDYNELLQSMTDHNFQNIQKIPFAGEDYIFKIHN